MMLVESLDPDASNATVSGAVPVEGENVKSGDGGGGGGVTFTDWETELLTPPSLVTVSVTWNEPLDRYWWETTLSFAVAPSPKFQAKFVILPRGSLDPDASHTIVSGTTPD